VIMMMKKLTSDVRVSTGVMLVDEDIPCSSY